MRQKSLNVLEFDKIKALIENETISDLGKEKVVDMAPATDFNTVEFQMNETDEISQIYNKHRMPSLSGLAKISTYIHRAKIGGVLSVSELNVIKRLIQIQNQYKTFYNNLLNEEETINYPILNDRMEQLPVLSDLYQSIHQKCDTYDLYDNASYELQGIRSKISSTNQRIKQNLDKIVKSQANQKKLSDAIVTVRNERNVIPVKAEYRQDFNGIVHDQSASGQTLYIEPSSIVEMSNQISRLKNDEAIERERILSALTVEVAEEADACLISESIMGQIDFLTAKARYASSIKGTKPQFTKDRTVYLPKAFHPLLDKQTVVANTIEFAQDIETVIITGPNTGGKTVTLKTLGLIIVMAQSGILIPTLDGSQLSIFENVYCDIGDEQSIEQSLSTFSSHMKNIVEILQDTTKNSLILFDELGAGTDPSEGAALAMSILDHVHEIGSLVMATTHYPELKAYSYNREGVMNASVEFDVNTLSPTYKLLMGVPGRSNAFDISKKLGLNMKVIQKAKSMIGQDEQEINEMIASLESNSKRVDEQRIELDYLLREAQDTHDALAKQYEQYQNHEKQLMNEAKEKANQRVKSATKEADDILKELRELRDQKGADVKEHELIDKKKQLDDQYEAKSLKQNVQKKKWDEINAGDEVKVLTYGQKGEVLELIDNNEAVVQMGIIKMKLPLEDLEKTKKTKSEPTKMIKRENRQSIKMELDLRGYRYDEAMVAVDQYLDQAVLSNYEQVYIIHGKGTGALQKGVQNHLKRHKSVASYRNGMPSEGGFGVTVVEIK
ncbi:recombination and DNA strand exchange inhibitor protein [Staphylococcus saprophyticus]|uniref:Endonuclease MutS2 n=2 Tax=Staphylococcus TaxID=1279 RepID=MUTS2_STAS1|nr:MULTISPECIES: endonuclease MutS2 [Staphylococcus]Q49WR1.1 RecName: Full=Endonuclease MutS2 [Staphylococcus saprophyticus subsp. saprophyticus ATCC 15305 = NCTC 7292]CRV23066.1 mismatch repair ATPase [Streptococcus equi subsp. equi]AMG20742.1 endonuclease MutS2 [Staphylococcus saprophyticus]AMG33814.1 endonuclease MutS2 [Staphylococcus saprophyticus]ASE59657.1 endonuclease MutS2 [Staphylococcus saprophyticus]ASF18457.1 endonuclease MutS2 [Staphylococcus saprophyticus]